MTRILLGIIAVGVGLGLLVAWVYYYLQDTHLGLPKHVNHKDWERVTHHARGFRQKKGRVS